MLPSTSHKSFPEMLRKAREAKGLSYTELAHAIGINPAMPSRYENRDHSCFCVPRESTWKKLNELFSGTGAPLERSGTESTENIWLGEATVEQMIGELKARGATSVQVSF